MVSGSLPIYHTCDDNYAFQWHLHMYPLRNEGRHVVKVLLSCKVYIDGILHARFLILTLYLLPY